MRRFHRDAPEGLRGVPRPERPKIAECEPLIAEAKRGATRAIQVGKVRAQRCGAAAKASEPQFMQLLLQTFQKYDLDKDGALDQIEVVGFAKDELGYDIDQQTLQNIWFSLYPGTGSGIPLEKFQALRSALETAHQQQMAKDRQQGPPQRQFAPRMPGF